MTLLQTFGKLRAAIGYLGERDQYGWWPSSFMAPSSTAFLAPVLGRTQVLAQCVAVTRAAALVHDDRIGVGNVHHLFRLPEDIEPGIHRALHDELLCQHIAALIASRESALAYLRLQAGAPATGTPSANDGPVRAGSIRQLGEVQPWRAVAAHYLRAFEQGTQVFPYFADRA